jgi:NADH-quinone oxidoreductase subunit J
MNSSQVVFLLLSAVTLVGAAGVVLQRNLFRAGLFLVLSFVGVAGFYIMLGAEVLAMIQMLVYVGAIAILIIFAIMLSRQLMSPQFKDRNEQWLVGLVAAACLFVVLVVALGWIVDWPTTQASVPDEAIVELGKALVEPDKFALPFEVASVLLLVALVGAVVIARER